jgi:hypothetical protein
MKAGFLGDSPTENPIVIACTYINKDDVTTQYKITIQSRF